MSDAEELASLTAYHHIVATRCLTFAGFTFLLYDHLITFSVEVSQVWSRPKNTVSLMFLFNRYLTPLMLMVDIYEKSGLALPPSQTFCSVWLLLEGYLVVLIFSIIHGLVAMRVCALYEQKLWIVVLLGSSLVAYMALMFTLVTVGLLAMSRNIRPIPPFNVCFAFITKDLWVVWLPSLILETLLFGLTIARVVQHMSRDVSMPITTLIYRDGTIYFVALGTASLLCLLDWLVAPATLNGLAKYFSYAMCVCASSRLVLNLRSLAPGNDVWTVSYDFPDADSSAVPVLRASSPAFRSHA